MVETALFYNFCKTVNDVTYDIKIGFKMEIANNDLRQFYYWCVVQYNQK